MFDNKAYQRQWYQDNKERLRPRKAELMRKYRAENPEKYNQQSRENKKKLRQRLMNIYGERCVLCGFEDIRALTLDHIKGNGAKERKLLTEWGTYRKALEEYRPDLYRTLCMNCQFIERSKSG